MSLSKPFTCRRARSSKRWAIVTMIAMVLSTVGGPLFVPTVKAQAQTAPIGEGFHLDAGDLRFIFYAIEIAPDHAAGGTLLGPGPNQVNLFGVPNAQLPLGLRTVDGSFNNPVPGPDQHLLGAPDLVLPRLTVPSFRPPEQGTSS